MRIRLLFVALFISIPAAGAFGQSTPLTASEAVKGMVRGINLGNSLDAPTETAWGNPPMAERYFSDLKDAGFDAVRIPVTWATHDTSTPPYQVDKTFMARVDTVVSWALRNGLFVILDAHHETWLKTALQTAAVDSSDTTHADSCAARFDSLWSQIATHFKDKSDSLIFEILNEPYPMSEVNVNMLNARVLKIIRRTNPTRIVSYSGYMWSNSEQLISAEIPDTGSSYLIGYYHSYDPWPFGLNGGDTTDTAIFSTIKKKFDQVTAWSQKNNIPVIIDEYGFIKTCAYNPRMYAYATDVDQALQHGVGSFAWDDGGDFTIYNRRTNTFNQIKDIIIHTYPQSPYGLSLTQAGPVIKLQWQNRNSESDSITIQRGTGPDSFADYAEVAPTDSVFIDSLVTVNSSYYYRLSVTRKDSVVMQSYPIMIRMLPYTSVQTSGTPAKFGLSANYPNPFNPSTVISYSIPRRGFVHLSVYDVLGRKVATLVDGVRNPGAHEVRFDGAGLASGVYFNRLSYDGRLITKKMMLLK